MKLVIRLAAGKAIAAVSPPVAEVLPAPCGRPFAWRERNRGVQPQKSALLAVLLGHNDLASPWEEVPDFYQGFHNSWIKHEQIVEQFAPPRIADAHPQLDEREIASHFEGELAVANPSLSEDDRSRIVNGISFTVPHDRQISVSSWQQRAGGVVGGADGPERRVLANIISGRRSLPGRGTIWALHGASLTRNFDGVIVLSRDKLLEQGTAVELAPRKDSLLALLAATE